MSEVTATTAMIYLLLFGAVMFSYFLDYSGVPEAMTDYLRNLPV